MQTTEPREWNGHAEADLTRRLIEAYAETEPWKEQHDRVMLCYDIEKLMRWGIHLFRGLSELEVILQARALGSKGATPSLDWTELEWAYRKWVTTSEGVLPCGGACRGRVPG